MKFPIIIFGLAIFLLTLCLMSNTSQADTSADWSVSFTDAYGNVWHIKALTTGSGTWTVPKDVRKVDILVVGGGGATGTAQTTGYGGNGGGGAGGVILYRNVTRLGTGANTNISEGATFSYSIGAGGTRSITLNTKGTNGVNTTFGNLTAYGGGAGAVSSATASKKLGNSGGSGGGGAYNGGSYGAGLATQGFHGSAASGNLGGGGGSALAIASTDDGADGESVALLFGTTYGVSGVFAGGGAGGHDTSAGIPTGGAGGGGQGGKPGTCTPVAGTNGTGGGAGGGYEVGAGMTGKDGGSGIILIRWMVSGNADLFIKANATTPINSTSANIRGFLNNSQGKATTCGFYLDDDGYAPYDFNYTKGVVANHTAYTYPLTGLTNGTFYRIYAWCSNSNGFKVSNIPTFFVTKPRNATLSLSTYVDSNNTQQLQWTNGTGAKKTVIRYATTGYPGSPQAGTEAYNGTGTRTFVSTTLGGRMYYYRIWEYANGTGHSSNYFSFSATNNTTALLTRPDEPTSISVTSISGTTIHVKWVNSTIGTTVTNRSTIVRYRTGSPPTSPTQGTLLGNYTDTDHASLTGVPYYTTYYFSAFTYVNATASPTQSYISDAYAWCDGVVGSVTYNFTVRWENVSTKGRGSGAITYPTNHVVNLRKGTNTSFVVVYEDRIEYNYFNKSMPNGTVWSRRDVFESNITKVRNLTGNWSFQSDSPPLYFIFTWNETGPNTYKRSCRRVLVAPTAYENLTFYIYTDKLVYGVSTSDFNNSLIPYTYLFIDMMGTFLSKGAFDTYAFIYTYDTNGTLMMIHSEFWDASKQIYPWLLYQKAYYIGIACSSLTINPLGLAPTNNEVSNTILILPLSTLTVAPNTIISIDYGWSAPPTGLWLNYTDNNLKTIDTWFYVYEMDNEPSSPVFSSYATSVTTNFSFPGADQDAMYKWSLHVNHSSFNRTVYFSGWYYPGTNITIANSSRINAVLNYTFGISPFRNSQGTVLPWVYVIIGVVAGIILLSFGPEHSLGATGGVGLWFILAGVGISALPTIGFLSMVGLIAVGLFLLIMTILAGLGGVR